MLHVPPPDRQTSHFLVLSRPLELGVSAAYRPVAGQKLRPLQGRAPQPLDDVEKRAEDDGRVQSGATAPAVAQFGRSLPSIFTHGP